MELSNIFHPVAMGMTGVIGTLETAFLTKVDRMIGQLHHGRLDGHGSDGDCCKWWLREIHIQW